VYPPAEIEAIGQWAAEAGIWVITDEIYEHLVYGDARHVSMPAVVSELRDRCVVVNGVAKTYAMTGWRVGWTIAPVGLTKAMTSLQGHATSNVANVSQVAAIAALEGPRVRFVDGTTEEVDLVLYATGYDWSMPYLPDKYLSWGEGRPDLYLTGFSRSSHNLFGVGYVETNSSAYTLFDHIANVVAQYLRDQQEDPARARRFEELLASDAPRLSGGIRYLDSARHRAYVDARAYKRHLAKVRRQMGWSDLEPGMFDHLRNATGGGV
jgi:hypothetical protein